MCALQINSRIKKIISLTLVVLAIAALCSCSSGSSSANQENSQNTGAPNKYVNGSVSIDSITAVVGSKPLVSNKTSRKNGMLHQEYTYSGLTDADFNAYGEYLLTASFEEIQNNIYSRTSPDGERVTVTLNEQTVALDGTASGSSQ